MSKINQATYNHFHLNMDSILKQYLKNDSSSSGDSEDDSVEEKPAFVKESAEVESEVPKPMEQ